jgi:hypothetical protein
MWLPREERRLLVFYRAYDADLSGQAAVFSLDKLRPLTAGRLRFKKIIALATEAGAEKGTECDQPKDPAASMKSWLKDKATVEYANKRLHERALIEYRERGTGQYEVRILLAGWDLGDKYMSWWSRSGLWFREYKDHWVWLIVSFLGGVLGALIVQSLSN